MPGNHVAIGSHNWQGHRASQARRSPCQFIGSPCVKRRLAFSASQARRLGIGTWKCQQGIACVCTRLAITASMYNYISMLILIDMDTQSEFIDHTCDRGDKNHRKMTRFASLARKV